MIETNGVIICLIFTFVVEVAMGYGIGCVRGFKKYGTCLRIKRKQQRRQRNRIGGGKNG